MANQRRLASNGAVANTMSDQPIFGEATEKQVAVLSFFRVPHANLSREEASRLIDELFKDPRKKAQWDKVRDAKLAVDPATERQLFRLQFAATRLRKSVPSGLSKREASRLIDEWYGNRPKLEEAYQDAKDEIAEEEEERASKEAEFENLLSNLEDWREFFPLKRLSAATVRKAVDEMGGLEKIRNGADGYQDVLRHIERTRPDLATKSKASGAVRGAAAPKQAVESLDRLYRAAPKEKLPDPLMAVGVAAAIIVLLTLVAIALS